MNRVLEELQSEKYAANSWHKILAATMIPHEAPSLRKFSEPKLRRRAFVSSSVRVNPLRSSEGEAGVPEGAFKQRTGMTQGRLSKFRVTRGFPMGATKVSGPNSVTYFNWTPILFEWCVIRCDLKIVIKHTFFLKKYYTKFSVTNYISLAQH